MTEKEIAEQIVTIEREMATISAVEIEPRRLRVHRLRAELASRRTNIFKGDVIEWEVGYKSPDVVVQRNLRRGIVQVIKEFTSGSDHYEFGVYRVLKGGKTSPNLVWVHHWDHPRKVDEACTATLAALEVKHLENRIVTEKFPFANNPENQNQNQNQNQQPK